MGDAPLGYVETVGGLKVSEDDVVMAGRNDVGRRQLASSLTPSDIIVQSQEIGHSQLDSNGLLIIVISRSRCIPAAVSI
jgi:hypothetical protein